MIREGMNYYDTILLRFDYKRDVCCELLLMMMGISKTSDDGDDQQNK